MFNFRFKSQVAVVIFHNMSRNRIEWFYFVLIVIALCKGNIADTETSIGITVADQVNKAFNVKYLSNRYSSTCSILRSYHRSHDALHCFWCWRKNRLCITNLTSIKGTAIAEEKCFLWLKKDFHCFTSSCCNSV